MENREIKFRVWDNNKKTLKELTYPWIMIGNEITHAVTGEKWRDVELMHTISIKERYMKET